MNDTPRYMRFIAEFEIEVVDPTAARVFTMDLSQGTGGEMGMSPAPTDAGSISAAVGQVISSALHEQGAQAGFKWIGGSTFERPTDGDVYPEFTIPELPVSED